MNIASGKIDTIPIPFNIFYRLWDCEADMKVYCVTKETWWRGDSYGVAVIEIYRNKDKAIARSEELECRDGGDVGDHTYHFGYYEETVIE